MGNLVPAARTANLAHTVSPLTVNSTQKEQVQIRPAVLAQKRRQLSQEQRNAWARQIGFRSIGKQLPEDVTLTEVVKSLPKECFRKDHLKSWFSVLVSIIGLSLGIYGVYLSPWYLLPLAWFFAGTAATGWFVIGHDCGHRSFHREDIVEDIVGTLMFAPLIYPFEPWRIMHATHHQHTNKLGVDTAWHPVTWEQLDSMSFMQKGLFKVFLGTPLKLIASIGHWMLLHFDLSLYTDKQKPRVIVSIVSVVLFMLTVWPALIYYTGWFGFIKYWLMPWVGYHFWMSTFTVVHHTAPHIEFQEPENWNAAQAQLCGTVHCEYPRWIDFLTHDISVHVPHHVCSKIPHYHLRAAHASLQKNWGDYLTEAKWNWTMMKYIFGMCHVYDEEKIYVSFDDRKEETLFWLQRILLGLEPSYT
eukprot:TRINITY_DN2508_c0_g1_i1.p1 TRINITY_DN2508_c0_g1~~TRINITY_DN2508_c0_g1_i1.p1  ORF type:complete len:415 (+),score=46.17 TRINITY_DN2508_c0_g1_i1:175-1419(+)